MAKNPLLGKIMQKSKKHDEDFRMSETKRAPGRPPRERPWVKITIRLDEDVVEHYKSMADLLGKAKGKKKHKVFYQRLINEQLRKTLPPIWF